MRLNMLHHTTEHQLLSAAVVLLTCCVGPLVARPPQPDIHPVITPDHPVLTSGRHPSRAAHLISQDVEAFLKQYGCPGVLPGPVLATLLRPLEFAMTSAGLVYNQTCTRPYPQLEQRAVADTLGELCALAFNTLKEACSVAAHQSPSGALTAGVASTAAAGAAAAAAELDPAQLVRPRPEVSLNDVCQTLSSWVTAITSSTHSTSSTSAGGANGASGDNTEDTSRRLYGRDCEDTCREEAAAQPGALAVANADCYGLYQGRRLVAALRERAAGGLAAAVAASPTVSSAAAVAASSTPAAANADSPDAAADSAADSADADTAVPASAANDAAAADVAADVAGAEASDLGGDDVAPAADAAAADNAVGTNVLGVHAPATNSNAAAADLAPAGVSNVGGETGTAGAGEDAGGDAGGDAGEAAEGNRANVRAGAGAADVGPSSLVQTKMETATGVGSGLIQIETETAKDEGAAKPSDVAAAETDDAAAKIPLEDGAKATAAFGDVTGHQSGAADTKLAQDGGVSGADETEQNQGDVRAETAGPAGASTRGSTPASPGAGRMEMPAPPVEISRVSPAPGSAEEVQQRILQGQAHLLQRSGTADSNAPAAAGPADAHTSPLRHPSSGAHSRPALSDTLSAENQPGEAAAGSAGQAGEQPLASVVEGGQASENSAQAPAPAAHAVGSEAQQAVEAEGKSVQAETEKAEEVKTSAGTTAGQDEMKTGETKLVDAKLGDAKPGDAKTGDSNVGEAGDANVGAKQADPTDTKDTAEADDAADPADTADTVVEEESLTGESDPSGISGTGDKAQAQLTDQLPTEGLMPVTEGHPAAASAAAAGAAAEGGPAAEAAAAAEGGAAAAAGGGGGGAAAGGKEAGQEVPPARPTPAAPPAPDQDPMDDLVDSFETGGEGAPDDSDLTIDEPQPVYKAPSGGMEQQPALGPYMSGAVPAESADSNFFAYFLTAVVLCIVMYLAFHNKHKILALVIEGRSSGTGGRRRPHSSQYRRLDNSLEEAISSQQRREVASSIVY